MDSGTPEPKSRPKREVVPKPRRLSGLKSWTRDHKLALATIVITALGVAFAIYFGYRDLPGSKVGQGAPPLQNANVSGVNAQQGDVIISQNQMGGQTAREITNIGPQPREISRASAEVLIKTLRKYPAGDITVTGLMSDSDSVHLASAIASIFNDAGWRAIHAISHITPPPAGVHFRVVNRTPVADEIGRWLISVGLKPTGTSTEGQPLKSVSTSMEIIIGPVR